MNFFLNVIGWQHGENPPMSAESDLFFVWLLACLSPPLAINNNELE
jgi:hypothetical protein